MNNQFASLLHAQSAQDADTLIVDRLHGYARIAQRLRAIENGLSVYSADGEPMLTNRELLTLLVGVASMCQLTAESLGLVEPQAEESDELKLAKANLEGSKAFFKQLLDRIATEAVPVPSLQQGSPRYKFEFDRRFIQELRDRAGV